ncbi:MAG: periplasmic heavy metal sensor [Deltaproteobacteria bacterium]|nr:periplasmic heavy metal sensor [Deltaproteobacteria bacterium]
MKHMNMKKFLVIVAVISLVGVGATAFAGWGRGSYGPMMHGRGWGAYGTERLSDEEYKQLEELNEAFFKETGELQRSIYGKELALRSEMIKENPDPKIAADLQKEISDLESRFDQKRLEKRLEMQKINPYARRGYMGRGGMGPGYMNRGYMGRGGMGMGRGQGGYGPYDCPWR